MLQNHVKGSWRNKTVCCRELNFALLILFAVMFVRVFNLIVQFLWTVLSQKDAKITSCKVSGNKLPYFKLRPRGRKLNHRLIEDAVTLKSQENHACATRSSIPSDWCHTERVDFDRSHASYSWCWGSWDKLDSVQWTRVKTEYPDELVSVWKSPWYHIRPF